MEIEIVNEFQIGFEVFERFVATGLVNGMKM